MDIKTTQKYWTDYPLFPEEEGKLAPIREVKVVGYDHNKYVDIIFDGQEFNIKRGYVYYNKQRLRRRGRGTISHTHAIYLANKDQRSN
ncbi:hypothetical protein [Sulfitobacter sp. R18_1]|uniref:hypothetical protein n=1 Tax=Sulfitobacter sp. R18_1 TaxID=2821104 RepID=UPI001ADAD0B0|nr:hypothetical protein [Sulfitobacter sp. R18_1]MBO9428152.1 hypothetical protein [Sulfitobacter sp. R18_1]